MRSVIRAVQRRRAHSDAVGKVDPSRSALGAVLRRVVDIGAVRARRAVPLALAVTRAPSAPVAGDVDRVAGAIVLICATQVAIGKHRVWLLIRNITCVAIAARELCRAVPASAVAPLVAAEAFARAIAEALCVCGMAGAVQVEVRRATAILDAVRVSVYEHFLERCDAGIAIGASERCWAVVARGTCPPVPAVTRAPINLKSFGRIRVAVAVFLYRALLQTIVVPPTVAGQALTAVGRLVVACLA